MNDALLEIRGVTKRFGTREVLRNLSLDVVRGEFLTILGESGSGKTTLLRLIAGFEKADSGELRMDGERIDPLPPYRRPVNTVFQQYALFPHLSVFENVAYGLRIRKLASDEIRRRVEKALLTVRMESFAGRAPATLSGGQQQRIALARAIVNEPKVLLLDEPLSALDAHLRRRMQGELKALQRGLGITFVFVTHDQAEAMALSDRVALLRHGNLEQIASPQEIYGRPATDYVAQFIGETNLQTCEVRGGLADWFGLRWPTAEADGRTVFSLRPEKIRLALAIDADMNQKVGPTSVRFRGAILARVFEGATEILEIDCGGGRMLRARIPSRGQAEVRGESEFEFDAADAIRVRESV